MAKVFLKYLLLLIVITSSLAYNLDYNNLLLRFERERLWRKESINTQSANYNARIINGNEVQRHTKPWMCGLLVSSLLSPAFTSSCGGSILSNNIVLTSAFCIENSQFTLVIAGAHRMFEFEDTQQRFYVSNENYIVHPEYDNQVLRNDIALLKLPQLATFNEYVKPIKLITDSYLKGDIIGEDVQIAGWGRWSDWSGTSSETLRYTTNRVIDNSQCSVVFGTLVSDSTICLETYYSRRSTCRGDHGSALTWSKSEDSERYVVGVASFGIWIFNFGCDPTQNNYIPTVNTNIAPYIQWILKYLSK